MFGVYPAPPAQEPATWLSVCPVNRRVYPWNPRAVDNHLDPRQRIRDPDDGWVEVPRGDNNAEGRCYFWNYVLENTVHELPSLAKASFRAEKLNDEWFYRSLSGGGEGEGELLKYLPGREPKDPEPEDAYRLGQWWCIYGAGVSIDGLQEDGRYNGQAGILHRCDGQHCHVELPLERGNAWLALPPRFLRPLQAGTPVRVKDLQGSAELNGEMGRIVGVDTTKMRYRVRLTGSAARDNDEKALRPANLQPVCRIWHMEVPTIAKPPVALAWNSEKDHTFVDSAGSQRCFWIQWPETFKSDHESRRKWPLLVYLHGAGACSFYRYCKKVVFTKGMRFAASTFVTVSPECNWKWKESPDGWVVELVKYLAGATWIDSSRIYLTGISMGGMGTWEICAQAPHLFAAIAPVAAHHKADMEDLLAKRLQDVPTFVLHAEVDPTCPKFKEEPLWEALALTKRSNAKLQVLPDADHSSIYNDAYCDNTWLMEWLLEHQCLRLACN
mmetsp:Transcript_68958/g.165484  ORF Transcript_68958/g.165484 Transcript_68958/m.165484 type:complete len:498 (-) Transcript_68958:31-1524(-)